VLGVRIGAFALFLPELTGPEGGFAGAFAQAAAADWRPVRAAAIALPSPTVPARALGLRGLVAAGRYAVPAERLERLDALLRGAKRQGGGMLFSDQAREELGWTPAQAEGVLRGLGFAPTGADGVWRRRRERVEGPVKTVPPLSPFAALAALKPAPTRRRRRRPPRQAHG
jgi:ATP-dependent RNA helicase SUPV3L1/SUV3